MSRSTLVTPDIDYPDSDGQPMAESEFQFNPIVYAVGALRSYYQDRHDVYVVGNLLLYHEEGNRGAAVAPDVFVVFGVPNHPRSSYLLWEERKAPDWVLEVTSRSTRQVDQGKKRSLYARLEIPEYWQYDPKGDYLNPPLQGFALSGGRYDVPLPLERVGAVWSAYSPVLGLNLRLDEGALRFHDLTTGAYLLTHQESEQARRQAEDRVAELEARLRALQQAPPSERPK